MCRLQSVLTSRFILNLRVADDDPDWMLTTRRPGGSGDPSILTFGRMGAPLDLDGDNERLERLLQDASDDGVFDIELDESRIDNAPATSQEDERRTFR